MTSDFARWYAQEFMDEGETRAARWKSVVALTQDAGPATIEVLVRLAFDAKDPKGFKSEKLASAHAAIVKSIGQDFDDARNGRELQVLAAASLVRLFENDPDAALAVTTASFGGLRKPELPMDVASLAARALVSLTANRHKRFEAADVEIEDVGIDFESEKENPEGETPTPAQDLDTLCGATEAVFSALVERQNAITAEIVRRMELGEEELQMLWWLISAHSQTLDLSFSKINSAAAPLILGYELGEMTAVSPGPASIGAIVGKAGIGTKKIGIKDSVNAVNLDWARSAISFDSISPTTTPIHFALEKRVEVGDVEAWQAVWTAQTGIGADAALPPAQLAELFYREYLFLHVEV